MSFLSITRADPAAQPINLDEVRAIMPAIFATGNHSSRSEKYEHLSTVQVMDSLFTEGYQLTHVSQKRSRGDRKGFAKHMLRFRHESIPASLGVLPEIVMINSHDGSGAWKMYSGLLRYACLNGLIAFSNQFAGATIAHRVGQAQNLIDNAKLIIEQSGKSMNYVQTWQDIEFDEAQKLRFAQRAHELRFFGREVAFKPEQLLETRRSADQGNDLWTTFNVVQENMLRGGQAASMVDRNGRVRQVRTRDVNDINANLIFNRGLWALGEEFATAA